MDYYVVLGIAEDADEEMIRSVVAGTTNCERLVTAQSWFKR